MGQYAALKSHLPFYQACSIPEPHLNPEQGLQKASFQSHPRQTARDSTSAPDQETGVVTARRW